MYEFTAALRDVRSPAVMSITSVSFLTDTRAWALSEGAESVSGSNAERTVSAISGVSMGISITA